MMQMVRVHNLGDKDFVDSYNSQKFIIEPGKSQFVPYDAAVIWFGNPAAVNTDREANRDEEFQRIQQRYSAYGDVDADGNPGAWDRNKPKVRVESTEGDELFFCMDDPQGERINTTAFRSELNAEEKREAQIASMETMMRQMQEQINLLTSQQQQGSVGEIPTDEPTQTPGPAELGQPIPQIGPITGIKVDGQ